MLKAITILALCLFVGFGTWPACPQQSNNNGKTVLENQNRSSRQLKILAEGAQSSIEDPFVAVIRDQVTYTKLQKMEPSLPTLETDFFRSNAVIAAFLGTRNTGGYSVEIIVENEKIRVAEKAPPKQAMTTQVITFPFKVVSFAIEGSTAIEVSAGEIVQQRRQLYRIDSGTFNSSGGFSGRAESFRLNGKLEVTRLNDLITIGFALVSSGTSRERSLRLLATGVVNDGAITLGRVAHGSLLDPPSGELKVSGHLFEKNRLTLEFVSEPINVPESYAGHGSIEAELVPASGN
jgi:hypothetical protein